MPESSPVPTDGATPLDRFLAAIRGQDGRAAREILAHHPELPGAHACAAACVGDADRVAALLAVDPGAATAAYGGEGWTPLLYVSVSPFHEGDPGRSAGMVKSAERLLAAGADPNAGPVWREGTVASGLPPLFWASAAGHAPLVGLLLERGADPNDGESIYHAAEHDRRECLELLLAHGADLGGAHRVWGNTPLYFLTGYTDDAPAVDTVFAGVRWLLEHGASPNVPSSATRETPLHLAARQGRALRWVQAFLDHGADVNQPRADGRTPYALAIRGGEPSVIAALAARGGDPSAVTPVDELLGACQRGDGAAARAMLAKAPGLIASLTPEDRQALSEAASAGRLAAVELMLALGFDPAWHGGGGDTPLHHAALRGNLPMVRALLAHRAPVDVRDHHYQASPLGWAAYGSRHWARADGDHAAVAGALLAVDGGRAGTVDPWSGPASELASPAVVEVLRRHGVIGPDG